MEGISPYYATPLAGGELCSGMVLVLTLQMMWTHGLKLGITHDKRRQILFLTLLQLLRTGYRQRFDKFCYFLYVIPLLVLIPIYFAIKDTYRTNQPLNTSVWNKNVYKPLNIGIIILTEGFATMTDLLLFRKVNASFIKLQAISESGSFAFSNNKRIKKTSLARQNLFLNYSITWLLIIIDITVKALIAAGLPLLFDSIITVLTVAMRSRANLQFGMEMQNVIEQQSSSYISSLEEVSVNQPTSELSHINNVSSKPDLEV